MMQIENPAIERLLLAYQTLLRGSQSLPSLIRQ